MPSPKLTPLESLFRQWFLSNKHHEERRSYRILFQRWMASFDTRRTVAQSFLEEKQLYRRAGLRTPGENAVRDMIGGHLWLQELVRLVLQVPDDDVSVLYIPTRPTVGNGGRRRGGVGEGMLPRDITENAKFTALQTSVDPWGWDHDADEDDVDAETNGIDENAEKSNHVSLEDLSLLLQAINDSVNPKRKTCIVWESVSPLIVRHGVARMVQFIKALPPCLLIVPVHGDSMSTAEHDYMEQHFQALLWSRMGQMNMLRQGVRESGNIIRESIPFRIESCRSTSFPYKLMEEEMSIEQEYASKEATSSPAPSLQRHDGNAAAKTANNNESEVPSIRSRTGKTKKVSLKIEEEEGEGADNMAATQSASSQSSQPSRPRIFLQDDDPEFDDLDEEDPDDDLDL